MSRISKAFKKGKALITFIMAGDPSLPATEKLVHEMEKSGADIIELGIPFSDSIADGPVIVEAAERAVKAGADASKVIALVKKIRRASDIPIVFMTSFNIVYSYGTDRFIKDSAAAGVEGFILPDLPIEEARRISAGCSKKGIDLILLLSPNSGTARIKKVAALSKGFIYLMSLTGTTGVRNRLSGKIGESVKQVRRHTKKPVAIGFGISGPDQAKEASRFADGVIVGSAIVDMAHHHINNVGRFVSRLKAGITM